MSETKQPLHVQNNPWQALRAHTSARIALGRVGASLPTQALLEFNTAHALARDAVHHTLDVDTLRAQLRECGFRALAARSMAADKNDYLLRPDKGRQLCDESRTALQTSNASDIAIVLADGLSSLAIESHAIALLEALRSAFTIDWSATPIVVVERGRVAIGDDIGEALRARLAIVLIGERPGLSSPDSLGIYLTYGPRRGRMDSERNCISNVRPGGLDYIAAAEKLTALAHGALELRLSGIGLKEGGGLNESNVLQQSNIKSLRDQE